jgi:hypothetical protein
MKAAATDAIKHVQAVAEKESGLKLQVLRTDNSDEFTATEFAAYCADEGIQRHYSASYSLQQNGVVERQNQTVVAVTRVPLKQVHLLNWSPTKSLEGKTLYVAWHECTPTVGHLRRFGCLAYVKELNVVNKLRDRSTPGMFIGYEGVKAYHILDSVTRCVRMARDVIFDEGRGWDWSKETNNIVMASSSGFTVERPRQSSSRWTTSLPWHWPRTPSSTREASTFGSSTTSSGAVWKKGT